MTTEIKPNFILITSMVDGYGYFTKKYIGYTKEEAEQEFILEVEAMESFARNAATSPHIPYEKIVDFQK